jgi:hypothetical protein
MNKGLIWILFSLFLGVVGLMLVVSDPGNRDGYHLIALGIAIFVILAITGSFNGGRRVKRK